MSYAILPITVLLFLSLILGAESFSRHYGPLPPPVLLPPLPPPPPRLQPIHAIADLANAIGNTLLKDLSQEGCNSAVSPFGAITALLLLWEGSGGPSFSQVDHALGLDVRNWDRSAIRIGYRDLHRHLRGYLSQKNFLSGIKLSNPRTAIKSQYLDILRFYGYNLEVLGVENITTMDRPEKRPTTEPTTISTSKENTPKIPEDTTIKTSPLTTKETTTNWILIETTTKQVTMITPVEEDNKSTTETVIPQDETTESCIDDPTTSPVTNGEVVTTTTQQIPLTEIEPITTENPSIESSTSEILTTPEAAQPEETPNTDETTTENSNTEIDGEVVTTTIKQIPLTEIEPITTENPSIESSTSEIVTTPEAAQPEETPNTDETTTENSITEIEAPIFTTESSVNEDLTTLVTSIIEEVTNSPTSTENINNQEESTEVGNANSEEISTPDNSMNPENSNNNEEESSNESSMAPSLPTETISGTDSTINPTENEIAIVDMTSVLIDVSTESPENEETQEITTTEQTNLETSDQIIFRPLRSLPLERGKKWLTRPLSFRNSIDLFENDDFFSFKQWSPIEDKGFFWWQPLERREEAPRTLLRQFFIPNEKPKLVSMMIYAGNLPYAEYLHALQGASALVLPLDDERYNLLILMPKINMNVDELVAILPRFPLRRILNSLTLTRVQSMVPSFRSQGIVDLTPSLNKHGVCDVFNEDRANLSRMALEPNLHVHHIEQEVTVMIRHYVDLIDVDSRLHRARGPPELFIADRPFVYYVVDKMTKVALVIGKMENPLDQNLCNN